MHNSPGGYRIEPRQGGPTGNSNLIRLDDEAEK
jgi:hypothetical protein